MRQRAALPTPPAPCGDLLALLAAALFGISKLLVRRFAYWSQDRSTRSTPHHQP
jgi:hypothetical protein